MKGNLLDRTMRKIEKAFDEYQVALENDDSDMDSDIVAPDHEKLFIEQVRKIVGLSLLDSGEIAIRVTMDELKELLADLKVEKEEFR